MHPRNFQQLEVGSEQAYYYQEGFEYLFNAYDKTAGLRSCCWYRPDQSVMVDAWYKETAGVWVTQIRTQTILRYQILSVWDVWWMKIMWKNHRIEWNHHIHTAPCTLPLLTTATVFHSHGPFSNWCTDSGRTTSVSHSYLLTLPSTNAPP